jgi:hypothetical protein
MTSYSDNRNFNYSIDSKILLIDSNDRDITKWPNSSEFEINCPQVYNNVYSLNLLNIVLPNPIYNISDYLQNNKLVLDISGIGISIITLEDGYYDVETLRSSLQNKINRTVSENLVVAYNNVSRKYYFGHTNSHIHSGNSGSGNNSQVTHNVIDAGFFKLVFDKQLDFSSSCVTNVNVYSQHSNWGLGYILGFDKKTYSSRTIDTSNNLTFDYSANPWIDTSNASVISSSYPHTLDSNENIYIELEKYNKCDELKPYLSYNYNNSNSGIVNSAFAKIPSSNLAAHNSNITVLLDNEISSTVSYFKPPIEKIAKLKIKIRYHNNMLVNLQNANVSLSLSVNQEVKDFAPLLR